MAEWQYQPVSKPQSTQADLNADEQEASVTLLIIWMYVRKTVHLATPSRRFNLQSTSKASLPAGHRQTTISVYPQSDNPQVNALRQILIDRPELQTKVKNAVGNHVDPLDEEVLSLFMRRHIQSYLEVESLVAKFLTPLKCSKLFKLSWGEIREDLYL